MIALKISSQAINALTGIFLSLIYAALATRGGEIGRRGGLKIHCQR